MGGESQSRSTLVCVLRGYQMAKEEELGEDFSYLIRIANTDIDGLKALKTALTSIRGVGNRTAIQICHQVNIPPSTLAGSLSKEQQEALRETLETYNQNVPEWMLNRQRDPESGDELHLIGQDLRMVFDDDISRLRSIKSYRGIRHAGGHKVRGQRGRSNGRFGLALGVQRKK
ncbi:MAG TPA: 30S ribosomal protein S13 [Candidatus Poseidoniales archaeon]|jgi:small subunit ribosomal protein S13|nr:MAG TPA: 30S ribosomal protein S13 [Candidatus Poseidoniales archaeon]|tara:strand:- start:111 stop:629 length:519 start_codon:yes stop_codon:yes gene_type:complete